MSRPTGRYSIGEIRRLVRAYPEVLARRDTNAAGIRAIIAAADIQRAVAQLHPVLRPVLLLHGIYGLPGPDVAAHLHLTSAAVYDRFDRAIRELQRILNGGQ